MIIQIRYVVTLFLLLMLQAVYSAEDNAQANKLSRTFSNPESFIDYFGEQADIPPDIQIIFNRINSVAYTGVYTPKLVVIKISEQDAHTLPPQVLPDDSVVITDKFIDLARTYSTENSDLFEAFMAFIIGHELAHFVHDDFERRKVLYEQLEQLDKPDLELSKYYRKFELEADKSGFLYAIFAGYKVGLLVREEADFFEFLSKFFKMKQAENKERYPSPVLRAKKTNQIWTTLHDKYMFYEYGVRFSIFEQCGDAISYFFREFRRTYQGKEIQNNIGVCYLQLAKRDMGDIAYFYWLPSILDGDIKSILTMGSTVTSLQSLKSARLGDIAKGNLEAAIEQFKFSINIAPYYFPSYFNLAISYLYLGEPNLASLILNEGFKHFQELDIQQQNETIEIQFKMLLLIAQYENIRFTSAPFQNIINGLKRLLNEYENPSPQVEFNLARLLEVSGRESEAQETWNKLAMVGKRSQLPKAIQEVVCNEQEGLSGCINVSKPQENTKQWAKPADWKSVKVRKILGLVMNSTTWQPRLEENWYDMMVSIYQTTDGKWEALFFDEYPILLVNKEPNETFESLSQYCPQMLRQKTLAENEVYLCENWAAKVIDGKVTEVWMQI
ncbi:MAG: hypothetical protein VSS52_012215 [Thiotrichaceae bacterium]|nr:hypothetical protein [Thiotrichaceae bacterium]